MAKVEYTSDARVLVGIDISKHRHEVLIGVPGKSRRRRMTVLNTAEDYGRLVAALLEYGLPVTIGFEATGNYHRALMFALGVSLGGLVTAEAGWRTAIVIDALTA